MEVENSAGWFDKEEYFVRDMSGTVAMVDILDFGKMIALQREEYPGLAGTGVVFLAWVVVADWGFGYLLILGTANLVLEFLVGVDIGHSVQGDLDFQLEVHIEHSVLGLLD